MYYKSKLAGIYYGTMLDINKELSQFDVKINHWEEEMQWKYACATYKEPEDNLYLTIEDHIKGICPVIGVHITPVKSICYIEVALHLRHYRMPNVVKQVIFDTRKLLLKLIPDNSEVTHVISIVNSSDLDWIFHQKNPTWDSARPSPFYRKPQYINAFVFQQGQTYFL